MTRIQTGVSPLLVTFPVMYVWYAATQGATALATSLEPSRAGPVSQHPIHDQKAEQRWELGDNLRAIDIIIAEAT